MALALLATACGGGDDSGGGGSSAGGDEGTPTPGGKVIYGLEAETADGWCLPEAQLAISGIMVARTVYDTLTRPNAEGKYEPWLAGVGGAEPRRHPVDHQAARGHEVP